MDKKILVYYPPDELKNRKWITPDEFIPQSGKYKGQKFRMLYSGEIIRVSKNGDKNNGKINRSCHGKDFK